MHFVDKSQILDVQPSRTNQISSEFIWEVLELHIERISFSKPWDGNSRGCICAAAARLCELRTTATTVGERSKTL